MTVEMLSFPADTGRRDTVLVVDDEPAIRVVLCEFLTDCGFCTLSAEDADQAIGLIGDGRVVDLVFSDVRMPGSMDGCGLARWIADNRPELPVILATGDLGRVNAVAGLSGVETFSKPYDFDTAVRRIRDKIDVNKQRLARSAAILAGH